MLRVRPLLVGLAGVLLPGCASAAEPATTLRFEVTLAKGLLDAPADGRLLVVLDRGKNEEPRHTIGETGLKAPPFLGRDVKAFTPGKTAVVDQTCAIFPIESLAHLPEGTYRVQAVLDVSTDIKLVNAPGNLYSEVVEAKLDPAAGGVVKLELSKKVPPEELPADEEYVKFHKFKSELLSKFHGRPMYLRVGVILPRGFKKDTDRKYPLRVRIGGYGTRYTAARGMMTEGSAFRKLWLADDTPRMVMLHLDGAGPYGDPYQVNSANNGPYGDAITQELIPFIEKEYRCVGEPYARVLDGHSTGGWVSLALQVFYPDFFNGCWSHAPDPVDFRAYELIDIYTDANAYVNRHGFERPAMRQLDGDTIYTVRHECLLEVVLGRGDRWEVGGRDWCAWNATFGPRGADGLPKPLWDGKTGKIDPTVLEHWKQYDLRLVMRNNWATLGPKLRGKIHIWVGEADDYFLNNAVHLMDDFLSKAQPAYEGKITYGPGRGHSWRGISDKKMAEEMAEAIERGRRAKESK
jgi:S-formylglutathione hydrolase FrmB